MAILNGLKAAWSSSENWTLGRITMLSFLFTGALLLGWDEIEHAYFLSGGDIIFEHRMHMIRGISTGVLVSVGIAWILLRKRRRYEQRMMDLQRRLIRKERLAAVGELAGGVAHEIRNPLAGIGGALPMLARAFPQDDESQEVMKEIQQQVHRMERLVEDLLSYARPGQIHAEWMDVQPILTQAAASVRQLPSLPDVNLVLDLDPALPEIYADSRDLEHAFENLIVNAFQAVSEGGKIEVRTRRVRDGVKISVGDDGAGMNAEIRERIFEPFFTTKARGTGLGLSLVLRAVEDHDGKILVTSAPGQGTTFEVVFSTKRGRASEEPEASQGPS